MRIRDAEFFEAGVDLLRVLGALRDRLLVVGG
jgi:hypothetical protein